MSATTLATATTTGLGPAAWLALAGLLLAAAGAYALSCWWFPYAHCRCCHGDGKHYRPDGKVHRLCRWCKGTGRRLRIGRRVYNFYALRYRATRTGGRKE